MAGSVAIAVLCIPIAGIAAQWLAWRMHLPAIVLLFVVGLLLGPGLQILRPAQDFGYAMRPLVGLAVAIVVFEGGLALKFRELRAAGEGVLRLTALALPLSFVLSSIAAHLLTRMQWGVALLFGAITVVTGPTVVLPMLRNTRLQCRAASFLKWEAIVNDPVGALLAAIVLSVLAREAAQHMACSLPRFSPDWWSRWALGWRRVPRALDVHPRPGTRGPEDADAAGTRPRRLRRVQCGDG